MIEYSMMKPKDVRNLIRAGKINSFTSGMCHGYAQANLVILPKELAFDFLLFTQRNPKPCPVLDVTEAGCPEPKVAAPGADIRYDIPKYRIYRYGKLTDEVSDLSAYWQTDLVAFLLDAAFLLKGLCWMQGLKYGTSQKVTMYLCILQIFLVMRQVYFTALWLYPCGR